MEGGRDSVSGSFGTKMLWPRTFRFSTAFLSGSFLAAKTVLFSGREDMDLADHTRPPSARRYLQRTTEKALRGDIAAKDWVLYRKLRDLASCALRILTPGPCCLIVDIIGYPKSEGLFRVCLGVV